MCLVLDRRNICIARKQMIQPFFLNQMGNNLDVYGAAIGLFHACKMSLNIGYDSHSDTFHDILFTNLRCSFLFASLLILQSLNPKVNVAFILFVLHFLLLVGNIESNPVPESVYISSTPLSAVDILSDKSISVCNINIRSIRNKKKFSKMLLMNSILLF
jgi:hypothetical protein